MVAQKGNRQYPIAGEAEKKQYLGMGYDIYDDKGKIINHAPNKQITYAEHEKLLAAAVEEAGGTDMANLKKKLDVAEKALAKQEKENEKLAAKLAEYEEFE